jgi:hypothetical protein
VVAHQRSTTDRDAEFLSELLRVEYASARKDSEFNVQRKREKSLWGVEFVSRIHLPRGTAIKWTRTSLLLALPTETPHGVDAKSSRPPPDLYRSPEGEEIEYHVAYNPTSIWEKFRTQLNPSNMIISQRRGSQHGTLFRNTTLRRRRPVRQAI